MNRSNHPRKKKSRLDVLLEDSPVSYYWVGFLIADGHMRDGKIALTIGRPDTHHLKRFKQFIGRADWNDDPHCDVNGNPRVYASDVQVVPRLMSKFGIEPRKTYHPSFPVDADDDLFYAALIGFIDGDGSICRLSGRVDCNIRLRCHLNWMSMLSEISRRVCLDCGADVVSARPVDVGKTGRGNRYAEVCWSNSIIVNHLKRKVSDLSLPALDRKWDRIDETRPNRYATARLHEQLVRTMIGEGSTQAEVVGVTGLTSAAVSRIVKRLGLTYTPRRGWYR